MTNGRGKAAYEAYKAYMAEASPVSLEHMPDFEALPVHMQRGWERVEDTINELAERSHASGEAHQEGEHSQEEKAMAARPG